MLCLSNYKKKQNKMTLNEYAYLIYSHKFILTDVTPTGIEAKSPSKIMTKYIIVCTTVLPSSILFKSMAYHQGCAQYWRLHDCRQQSCAFVKIWYLVNTRSCRVLTFFKLVAVSRIIFLPVSMEIFIWRQELSGNSAATDSKSMEHWG